MPDDDEQRNFATGPLGPGISREVDRGPADLQATRRGHQHEGYCVGGLGADFARSRDLRNYAGVRKPDGPDSVCHPATPASRSIDLAYCGYNKMFLHWGIHSSFLPSEDMSYHVW